MQDQRDPEVIFLGHLREIHRAADAVCRRRGVSGDDADDFVAWVTQKLIENDYAVLRRFRGESRLVTYLTTVVVQFYREYARARWGRWRPSAGAKRLGSLATDLEALVYRDGYRLTEAGEVLRTSGRTTLSDAEIARLFASIPKREPLRPVEVPADLILHDAPSSLSADAEVTAAEAESRQRELLADLDRAMGRLEPEERLIVQMYFGEGNTLREVAQALNLKQKPLAERLERIRLRLREYLEDVQLHNFHRPGILGPDGLPISQEDLKSSRIVTDVISTNEKILRMVRTDPNSIFDLSPRQFEELVAELLHKQGYEIVLTPPSRDGGFDMYAARKDGLGEFLYLVECKRYSRSRPVGVDLVRALYGVVMREQASAGILVTTSRFTSGAAEFQRTLRHRLSLRDYLHLQGWLATTLIEPAAPGTLWTPR